MSTSARKTVYGIVTEQIIENLKKGIIPWRKPWTGSAEGAVRYSNLKPYSLLNQMLLGRSGEWLSFRMVQEPGGTIKQGAKSRIAVFSKPITEKVTNDEGREVEVATGRWMVRFYRVFHISDTEGVKSKIAVEAHPELNPIGVAENIIGDYFSRESCQILVHRTNVAHYLPGSDTVETPELCQFSSAEEYYSTIFHEMAHSTGHPSRLDRNLASYESDSTSYSVEELVAEMTAAYLCAKAGIENKSTLDNSTAYIQHWIRRFAKDEKLIFRVAAMAEKAANYILFGSQASIAEETLEQAA